MPPRNRNPGTAGYFGGPGAFRMSRLPPGWNRRGATRALALRVAGSPSGEPAARPCWAARAVREAGRLEPAKKLLTGFQDRARRDRDQLRHPESAERWAVCGQQQPQHMPTYVRLRRGPVGIEPTTPRLQDRSTLNRGRPRPSA